MPDQNQTPTPETHTTISPKGIGTIYVPNHVLSNPEHLDALSKSIAAHPTYIAATKVAEPTAPEISDTQDQSALNGAIPTLTAENAIENHPDFRKAVQQAWARTGNGSYPMTEAGFTVDRAGNISHIDFHTGSSEDHSAKGALKQHIIPGETLLALHAHPDDGERLPSENDRNIAKSTKTPIYVQTHDGLFQIDALGAVRQVFAGSAWMSEKKKK